MDERRRNDAGRGGRGAEPTVEALSELVAALLITVAPALDAGTKKQIVKHLRTTTTHRPIERALSVGKLCQLLSARG